MRLNPFHRAIYLTGATAVGKTAVGVALARRLEAEVVALDSMTLYRGMDIGTAKPSLDERGGVPHHLIDVIDPWESASVADYRQWARNALLEVESRARRVLFVGGTALYLKALLRGLFEGPAANPQLRQALEEEAGRGGDLALHERLSSLDPKTASRLHANDRRRVIRALEVIALTGRPLSDLQAEHDTPAQGVAVFALTRPRRELRDRIGLRVDRMFATGLVDEVRGLMSATRPLSPVASQGVGYREGIAYLEGRTALEEAIELVKARSRQFAKRQATWFRGLREVKCIPVGPVEAPETTADRICSQFGG
jgi:tRNA dimethylallyltransferase